MSNRNLAIEARVYDDGVAFRYVVPQQPQTQIREFRLARELTEFHFARDGAVYPLYRKSYRTSYEGDWVRSSLTRLLTDQLIGLPLLTEIPGIAWMAITEADLDQYAGMFITNPSSENANTPLAVRLSPSLDEPGIAVTGFLPRNSPWRVLMIADHPGRLIESNIILNLNPPCALADTSWIKPGKSSWGWWSGNSATGADFRGAMDTKTMNYCTDFAARAASRLQACATGLAARV